MPANSADTIKLRVKPDGSTVQVLPDGTEAPYVIPEPDHARLDALPDADVTAAAESDPDNPPLTDAELDRMELAARIRRIRRRLDLSQDAFAARFRLPVGSVRDWEQARRQPDAAALAYLAVIEREPEAVLRALRAA